LPKVRPYKDFIQWLAKQDRVAARNYWENYLKGYDNVSGIPEKRRNNQEKSRGYAAFSFSMGNERAQCLERLALRNKVTLYTVIKTLWAILLSRYNNKSDVVFASVVAGRPAELEGIEQMVGLFINAVPVRIRYNSSNSFTELLKQVQTDAVIGDAYNYYPLAEIQSLKKSGGQLLNHVLVYENYPFQNEIAVIEGADSGNAKDERLKIGSVELFEQNSFDLSVVIGTGEEMNIRIEYRQDIYEESVIKQVREHLIKLADDVTSAEGQMIGNMPLVETADIFSRVGINGWYGCGYRGGSIIEVFEESVSRYGSRACLVFGGRSMSYEELNCYSNRVGRYLREECGVVVGDLVGLLSERSEWMIVGILGIMKSGAGYVPLDPLYPEERVSYMVEDAGLKCVVRSGVFSGFSGMENVVRLEDICVSGVVDADRENIGIINEPDDVAYVIYTSGSTGRPKGCMVEHRNVLNLLKSDHDLFGFTPDDVWVMVHSFCFDFSVWEMYGALLNGGRLVIADWDTVRDTSRLYELLVREGVTVLNQTPGAFYNLIEVQKGDMEKGLKRRLRYVVFGGDKLNMWQLRDWVKEYGLDQIALINMYGITETTVHVSYYRIREEDVMREGGASVIGRSLPGVWMELLDEWGNVVPRGVIGELYVGGNGVSRGYINNKELTDLRFVEDVHSPGDKAGKLYRTGDLGRQLDEERMEYLGRKDGQVKIRGYRIELGEIESVLSSYAGVESAVVGVRGEGTDKYLVGYYRSEENIIEKDIRVYCQGKMPGYMVPLYLIRVERYPLTGNGKLDWSSLPDPVKLGLGKEELYEMARDDQERELVSIWEEILEREGIGIRDNFFELGGHSLKAIRVAGYISKRLKQQVSLKELFSHPTIAELSEVLRSKGDGQHEQIPKIEEREKYALSHAQKRLWIIDQLEGGVGGVYNIFGSYIIEGAVDREALRESLELVVDRHESLRTIFVTEQGEPYQKICSRLEVGYGLEYVDLRGELGGEEKAKELIAAASGRGFDLSQGPLIRTCLVQLEEDRYLLLLTLHHIIADGWSLWLMSNETLANYQRLTGGGGSALPELRIQYRDYAAWQNGLVGDKSMMSAHREYWTRQLSGELPVLNLPLDYPRPEKRKNNGSLESISIEHETYKKILSTSNALGISVFTTTVALVNVLLYRYTGNKDIIIGTTTSGREHFDLESQIGLFLNPVAIRTSIIPEESFQSFLKRAGENVITSLAHQSYPFDRIIEDINLVRDPGRMPVFDVVISFHNIDLQTNLAPALSKIVISDYQSELKNSKYDLVFHFHITGDGLLLQIEYNVAIFRKERILGLLRHFRNLAQFIFDDPATPINRVEFLGNEERLFLTNLSGNTKGSASKFASVTAAFEYQVSRSSEKIAVISQDSHLTYGELNDQSNRLATYLRKRLNIAPNEIIAIMADRTPCMIVSIIAVLKSGAAYLPVDPATPAERIAFMLSDSGAKVLLTDSFNMFHEVISLESCPGVIVVDVSISDWENEPSANISNINSNRDIAYTIYTSGTTGRPKGCMVEHRGCVNMIESQIEEFAISDQDRLLQFASISFDASVYEIFIALLSGAGLVLIPPQKALDTVNFISTLEQLNVSVMVIPPVFLNTINLSSLQFLRVLVTAGESPRVESAVSLSGKLDYYNAYGPTECSVCVSTYKVTDADKLKRVIPIGRPVKNMCIHVLDEYFNLLPVGVPGQICVSGLGVASGYVNLPDLSSQKFPPNPFIDGERMYLTGDSGRWLDDGNLEFIGRIDQQIKIRGVRIEPGEIEHRMNEFPGVVQSVVITRTAADEKYLVGYYSGEADVSANLREYLRTVLTDYMVPTYLIYVPKFPVTQSGKIDKERLPDPAAEDIGANSLRMRNLNKDESRIAKVWEEVLGRTGVGPEDNFFQLGGDSIKAVRIVSRLSGDLLVNISIADVFNYPTIKELTGIIGKVAASETCIPLVEHRDSYDASFAQTQVWMLQQMADNSGIFNMHLAFRVSGAIDAAALSNAFRQVVARHEILRTRFQLDDGMLKQIVCANDPELYSIRLEDISDQEPDSKAITMLCNEEASLPFDVSEDPLVRCRLIRISHSEQLFLLTIHHMVADGRSMSVFFSDMLRSYNDFNSGGSGALEPLRIQYKDFAAWQHSQVTGAQGELHRRFWANHLSGSLPSLNLTTSFERVSSRTFAGKKLTILVEDETKGRLGKLLVDAEITIFILFWASVKTMLYAATGQNDIVAGTPVDSRKHLDLESQIGLYLSFLPLRVEFEPDKEFADLVRIVKSRMLEIYDHDVYPLDLISREVAGGRTPGGNPLFDIIIQDQGKLDVAAETAGSTFVMEIVDADNNTSKFDLTFSVSGFDGPLVISLEYNSGLFSEKAAEKMLADVHSILCIAGFDPTLSLRSIRERLFAANRSSAFQKNESFIAEINDDY
jgi:amino acid adenylation domain-containing protein